jgi:hypothetical protein
VNSTDPAPSTGATAGGESISQAEIAVLKAGAVAPLVAVTFQAFRAEVAQLRAERDESLDLCARGAAEIIALRADLAQAQADVQRGYQWQQGYAVRLVESQTQCDQLRAQVEAMRGVVEASREVRDCHGETNLTARGHSRLKSALDQAQPQEEATAQ